jgi:hypothetical protein
MKTYVGNLIDKTLADLGPAGNPLPPISANPGGESAKPTTRASAGGSERILSQSGGLAR